jgi:2-polyprenyl-6-methoxyphenol hydroxylase-like FAD-dependent oxidoreductase
MTDIDVLITGAGPTGLVLALWLVRLGICIRIIDKAEGPGMASRAFETLKTVSDAFCLTVFCSGFWTRQKRPSEIPSNAPVTPTRLF